MRKQYMATRAFTLIELLVVVGIIGLLASLSLTGIGSAKNKARRMACAHNLRQINLGLLMYIDDSRDAPGARDPDPGDRACRRPRPSDDPAAPSHDR